mgnify:CR=1 FL=1
MVKKSKNLLRIAFLLFIIMCVILSVNLTKGIIETFEEKKSKKIKQESVKIPAKMLLRPATYLCPNNCQTSQFTDSLGKPRYGFYIKEAKITVPPSGKIDFKDINDPIVKEEFTKYFIKSFLEALPDTIDPNLLAKMKIDLKSVKEEPIYYHNFTGDHINNWTKGLKNEVMEKIETRGLMVRFEISVPFDYTDIPVDTEETEFKKSAFNKNLHKEMNFYKIVKMLEEMSINASSGKYYVSIPERYSVEDDRGFIPSNDYLGEKNGFTYATSYGINSLKDKSNRILQITNMGNGYYRNYSHAWDILYMSVTMRDEDEKYLWKYPSLKLSNELDNATKLPNTLKPGETPEPNQEEAEESNDKPDEEEPNKTVVPIQGLLKGFIDNAL